MPRPLELASIPIFSLFCLCLRLCLRRQARFHPLDVTGAPPWAKIRKTYPSALGLGGRRVSIHSMWPILRYGPRCVKPTPRQARVDLLDMTRSPPWAKICKTYASAESTLTVRWDSFFCELQSPWQKCCATVHPLNIFNRFYKRSVQLYPLLVIAGKWQKTCNFNGCLNK